MRGRGLVVSKEARDHCVTARQELISSRLREVLTEALHAGLSAKEICRIVSSQLEELDGNVATIRSLPSESPNPEEVVSAPP
jgi:GntR family transcriptional regulator